MKFSPIRIACVLFGYALPFMLFIFVVSKKSYLIIFSIIGALVWLVSFIPIAIFGMLIKHHRYIEIEYIVASVFFQTCGRYVLIKVYRLLERIINRSENVSISGRERNKHQFYRFRVNDVSGCLSTGLGFAVMHSFIMYGALLSVTFGEIGEVFAHSCPQYPMILIQSIVSFLFILLDIIWVCIAFYADATNAPIYWVLCTVFHILAAWPSHATSLSDSSCITSFSWILCSVALSCTALGFIGPPMLAEASLRRNMRRKLNY